MKRAISLLVMLSGLYVAAAAGVPVQDLSLTSLGLDYTGMWRGEQITLKAVAAHENVQLLNFRYAPLPYVAVSLGAGVAGYSVDTCDGKQFKGGYGMTPSFGIDLYSPFLLNKLLRVTAGVKGYYLYTKNKDKSWLYSGTFVNPSAGIIFSASDRVDIEVGGRGLYIFGEMGKTDDASSGFSNNETGRGYLTILLHSPSERAYFALDLDASPNISADWTKGPAEASIGVTLGFIISKKKEKADAKTNVDYPGYKEMQKKMEEMEKEQK